jgi:leucyl aminopeptidase
MNMRITTIHPQQADSDVLVVGAVRTQAGQAAEQVTLTRSARAVDELLGGLLKQMGANGEFKGNLGEIATVYTLGKLAARRLIVVGLGKAEKVDSQALRRACAIVARHAQKTGAQSLALALDADAPGLEEASALQAEAEGALLGLYTFRKYRQQSDTAGDREVAQLSFLVGADRDAEAREAWEAAIQRGTAMAEATNFARDLVNEPPNVLTPSELARRASAMADEFGLECQILDGPQMQELGMGGLLAVAQGSAQPPKFIILRYLGAAASSDKGMALVGKGITFDSGGISLKQAAGMHEMKGDMAGAAAVLGAMRAIARLKPAYNVTALVSSTENVLGESAYRPGDILRIMNGKTIEIVNTDAEGRLVLADGLSYAARQGLSPIIDVATLTGGIVVALGSTMAGAFCNDAGLCDELLAAGRDAGEKFWPMPLDDEYAEQIKSEIADIKQTGGRGASAITAAKILEHFVGEAKWAHLDVAGTTFVDSPKPYQESGATGFGVRTLAQLAARLAG